MSDDRDIFRNVEYRKVIKWSSRIQREWPFLREVLAEAPSRSVLDIGCASGEHAAFLHEQGFTVVGIDKSEEQIAAACDYQKPPGLRFQLCDFSAPDPGVEGRFGAALSLGNVLPFLDDDTLPGLLTNTRTRLAPGGIFAFQLLNYARVFAGTHRHMPLTFLEDPEGEVVFARIFSPAGDRHVVFRPTTLVLPEDPEADLQIRATRSVLTRAWNQAELTDHLGRAGFGELAWYGSIERAAFDPETSQDLIGMARAV